MHKLSASIILIFVTGLLFAGFSVTPTMGAGYIEGSRVFTENSSSYRKLAADGTEVGIEVGYSLKQNLRAEAYFDYLFASNGGMTDSVNEEVTIGDIDSDMSYTDYKAGLGVGYFVPINEKNSLRVSSGINFAGISNHKYSSADVPKKIENEQDGNKVTSFGIYIELADHFQYSDKLDFTFAVHSCLNTFGWIRTLENHKWINHFNEKSEIKLGSIFAQVGVCYNF